MRSPMAIARDAPAPLSSPPTDPSPGWGRTCLAFFATTMFFSVATLIGAAVSLLSRFRPRDAEARARYTRRLNRGFLPFVGFLQDTRLISYRPCTMPEAYRGRPVLVVANHPSLLDVVLLLPAMPELVTVVKESWYRSWVMGPMLRATDHLPGPGHEGDAERGEAAPVVRRIAEALERGKPVLAFPEGTRSPAGGGLRRLRRGSIEAAVRAGVDVLPLFIHVDRPFLTKGRPIWHVPAVPARFEFEWLDPIPTRGRDARAITRDLGELYRARLASRQRGDDR